MIKTGAGEGRHQKIGTADDLGGNSNLNRCLEIFTVPMKTDFQLILMLLRVIGACIYILQEEHLLPTATAW